MLQKQIINNNQLLLFLSCFFKTDTKILINVANACDDCINEIYDIIKYLFDK